MYVEKLHIDFFGCFQNQDFEFHNGLNLITEDNEFGKSTLRDFIIQMFFGFANRSAKKRSYYDDNKKTELGGSITLVLDNGSRICLKRKGKKVTWTDLAVGEELENPEEELRKLTGLTANWYSNIYAVSLNEIAALKNEDSDDFFSQFCGSRLTLNNRPLSEVENSLKNRADEFFNSRKGAKCRYSELDAKLASLEAEEAQMSSDIKKIPQLNENLKNIVEKINALNEEASKLDGQLFRIARIAELQKQQKERNKISHELENLNFTPLPGGWQEEYWAALGCWQQAKKAREEAALPDEDIELVSGIARVTENAFNRFRQLSRQNGVINEEYEKSVAKLRKRCRNLYLFAGLIIAVIVIIALAFLLRGKPYLSACVAVLAVIGCLVWFSCRKLKLRKMAKSLKQDFDGKSEKAQLEVVNFRREYRIAENEENVESCLRRRMQIQEKLAIYRKCEEECSAGKQKFAQLQEQYRIYNDEDVSRYRVAESRFAELNQKLKTAENRLAELTAELMLQPLELVMDCQAKTAELNSQRKEKLTESDGLQQQRGRIRGEIDRLGRLDILSVRSQISACQEDLRKCARDYLTAAAAGELLKLAIKRYEADSQPEMVKLADKWFGKITAGRYSNLHKSLNGNDSCNFTVLDNSTKTVKPVNRFSRGTLEQLVISLRLAMIELWEKEHEKMPVIMDDVAVNFDETRRNSWQQVMKEFTGDNRQTIIFNCR